MMELTENLLQKLEEKLMLLLTESEDMRHEIQRLKDENLALRHERERHAGKLTDLVSLLDSVGVSGEETLAEAEPIDMVQPAAASA